MNVQIIEKDGRPEWAIVPFENYQQLVEQAEMAQDVQDYDDALRAIEADEELVPSEVLYAILDGANPIRVWRKHRDLTQKALAERAGISKPYLSQIEAGKRTGTIEVLTRIAEALGLLLDDVATVEQGAST